MAWIIFGISYSILSLAGLRFSHPPNHTLCTFQAALLYAAPPLVVNTVIALIIQADVIFLHFYQALTSILFAAPFRSATDFTTRISVKGDARR